MNKKSFSYTKWLGRVLLFLSISYTFIACSPEEESVLEQKKSEVSNKLPESLTLGKKLNNPYSVENMRKAYQNLVTSNANACVSGEKIDISTTHLYVKFKPKNEDELAILKRDSTLILFSYPLDQEIIKPGHYYHDPAVPAGQPTYQYASVEVTKKLPSGVEYEVLSELFIPDDEKDGKSSKARFGSDELVNDLVDEAMRITGNLKDVSASNARTQSHSWRPSGRVLVWDDQVRAYVPVVDVGVRAKRWFTVHTGTTDAQGNFSCDGTFKNRADYSIHWEKYHFSIRSGTFGQAESHNTNREGPWNPTFGVFGSQFVNHVDQYYALIFQAARDYYYGTRFGLASPPRNSTLHPQIKIAADMTPPEPNRKPSHAAMYARTGGIFPSIYVRRWASTSDAVYAVTAHELAHAAHWDMDRTAFKLLVLAAYSDIYSPVSNSPSSEAVIESWANGVEWRFARERYRGLFGDLGYEYDDEYQLQSIADFPLYTSIVVDMIDFENQRNTRHGGSVAFPNDRVGGYNIIQVQEALRGAASWQMWRDNMVNRYNNETEGRVIELFSNWY